MGGAEQTGTSGCRSGRGIGSASGQEVRESSAGLLPVGIAERRESERAGWFYRIFTERKAPVLGTLLLPFRHLSFDHAWFDPIPPRVGPLPLPLPEHRLIPRRE